MLKARDDCTTLFFVEGTGRQASETPMPWREVTELDFAGATVSWRHGADRYSILFRDVMSARAFTYYLQEPVVACSP